MSEDMRNIARFTAWLASAGLCLDGLWLLEHHDPMTWTPKLQVCAILAIAIGGYLSVQILNHWLPQEAQEPQAPERVRARKGAGWFK